jgi:hypothetical protein
MYRYQIEHLIKIFAFGIETTQNLSLHVNHVMRYGEHTDMHREVDGYGAPVDDTPGETNLPSQHKQYGAR